MIEVYILTLFYDRRIRSIKQKQPTDWVVFVSQKSINNELLRTGLKWQLQLVNHHLRDGWWLSSAKGKYFTLSHFLPEVRELGKDEV